MKYTERIKASAGNYGASSSRYVIGAFAVCSLILFFAFTYGWRKPVVETITTEEGSQTRPQPGPAVHFTPQLPERDADIESAGDHLAAATVYLKNRQSAAALRAMTQARSATAHAIDRRRLQGKRIEVLEDALREIDSAERYIQRGALGDARARLASLNNKLDASLGQ